MSQFYIDAEFLYSVISIIYSVSLWIMVSMQVKYGICHS